jgi:hypothetical protein
MKRILTRSRLVGSLILGLPALAFYVGSGSHSADVACGLAVAAACELGQWSHCASSGGPITDLVCVAIWPYLVATSYTYLSISIVAGAWHRGADPGWLARLNALLLLTALLLLPLLAGPRVGEPSELSFYAHLRW